MGFFSSPRGQKISTSPVEQIESLNTRLEKARQIVIEGRIFPVINKESHYVVQAPDGNGFYVVSQEGCCTDGQHHADLLEGYCEHRLAVNILKDAPEGSLLPVSPPIARNGNGNGAGTGVDQTTIADSPPAAKRAARPSSRSRKTAAEATVAAEEFLNTQDGPPA